MGLAYTMPPLKLVYRGLGEVMVFLGPNYVITVRHGGHSGLAELRSRLEEQRDLLCLGPSAVLYAVADLVVSSVVCSDQPDDLRAAQPIGQDCPTNPPSLTRV